MLCIYALCICKQLVDFDCWQIHIELFRFYTYVLYTIWWYHAFWHLNLSTSFNYCQADSLMQSEQCCINFASWFYIYVPEQIYTLRHHPETFQRDLKSCLISCLNLKVLPDLFENVFIVYHITCSVTYWWIHWKA